MRSPLQWELRTGRVGLVLGVRLELTLTFLLREWLLPIERPELVARVFLWKAWAVPGFASPCWRGEWSRSST